MMRHHLFGVFGGAFLVACGLGACGSDSADTAPKTTASSSASGTAGQGGTAGGGGEAGQGGTTGGGGEAGQGGTAGGAGGGATGGGPVDCGTLPQNQCVMCCSQQNQDGAVALFKYGADCACSSGVCATPCEQACDAGENVTLQDLTQPCLACVATKINDGGGGAQCAIKVLQQCNKDPVCKAYRKCSGNCVI